MKDKIKKIFAILVTIFCVGLFIGLLWSLLHIQTCKTESWEELDKLSCEEQAEKIASSCEYVILQWKKVEPSQKEIDFCKDYVRDN